MKFVKGVIVFFIALFIYRAGAESVGAKNLIVCPNYPIWNWAGETATVRLADLQSLYDSGQSGVTTFEAIYLGEDSRYLFEVTWQDEFTIYQFQFWVIAGDAVWPDRYYLMPATKAAHLLNLLSTNAQPQEFCD